jgi:phosphinothricin acetyltransferase
MPSALRLAEARDAVAIAAIYAPYVDDTVISFEMQAPDPAEMARRLATVSSHAPWLVCESEGGVVGYAYLSRHHERSAYRWSVDTAVYVARERRGGGIGRALYTTLFALGKLQGFCAVHAGITQPNDASVALHEAFGFRRIATYPKVGYKFGAWHDVAYWQLELRERQGAPPPITLPDATRALHPEEWHAALDAGGRLLRAG